MEEDNLYIEIDRYVTLLKKYSEGNLNKEERKELAGWLWRDRANRDLLQKFRSERLLKEYCERAAKIDDAYEYKLLLRRYPRVGKPTRRSIAVWRYAVAVSVACLFIIGGWVLLSQPEEPESVLASEKVAKVQAVLTTAEGKVIVLQQGENEILTEHTGSFELRDSVKELVYKEEVGEKEFNGFHKLEIPRGGEYNLVLPDGTFVRLNSESSIRFPAKFSGQYREIEVSGEVYFNVAKDAEHPFIARAGEFRTEVLGTRFGMRVYPSETEWSTVLEEGKVKVSYRAEQVVLSPGEKAYMEDQSLKNCSADIEKELAWVDGFFVFKHDRLEHVLKELSRWYNVEFVFNRGELKDYLFTGKVNRDLGIDKILSLIERMNVVKFKKDEKYIVVEKNDKVNNQN